MIFKSDLSKATDKKYPYFLPFSLEKIFLWMDKNLSLEKIVLASEKTGSYIPTRTGLRTYIGYYSTLNRETKKRYFEYFMNENVSDLYRKKFLKLNKINYFLFGDFEREIGGFNPENKDYLKKMYSWGSILLYKVEINE
ncbi:MAG: hypothetical protein N2Z79_02010 [Candidatus Omnitrophica bacterium]|nr:hypothetical protein [Candidatus Omnitrophota bacterium]